MLLITGGPIVMLGTKCPSITSICIQSAPPFSTALIPSSSLAKSAESKDGASLVISSPPTLHKFFHKPDVIIVSYRRDITLFHRVFHRTSGFFEVFASRKPAFSQMLPEFRIKMTQCAFIH